MSGSPPLAVLLADAGSACAGEEFFRSAEFFVAEGVTHTLRIEDAGGELLAPLIVRAIEGEELRDAVSPYGYPGVSVRFPAGPGPGDQSVPAIDPAAVDFTGTGLVSVFIRHRLGPPPLLDSSDRNTVQIADPELPRKSRMSDRQQIRRNLRSGLRLEVLEGPDSSSEARRGFAECYEQTMRRTGAPRRYFFGTAYFEQVLASPRSRLALAWAPDGDLAAGSLAVRSDGMLHYYLSGTADAHLRSSPMKNIVEALVDHAWEVGLPLNLGGGLSPGDALEEFKRGFANRREAWHTSEIVCDRTAYERLAAGRAAGDFFPAYRAP